MAGQERNQDSKANQCKEEAQQPSSNLEYVQRPAPAIPSSTLDLHLRNSFTQILWSCLIRRFIADIHLQKSKMEDKKICDSKILSLSPSPGEMLRGGEKAGETKMTTHLRRDFSLHRGFVIDCNLQVLPVFERI